jgi:hypothetical protein
MIDLGVAVTWIAITVASAKGLTVFARAAVIRPRVCDAGRASGHEQPRREHVTETSPICRDVVALWRTVGGPP